MMKKDYIPALAKLLNNGTTIELETNHYFSEGICIREMIAPQGTLVLGAAHRTNHLTTLVKGVMQIRIGDESRLVEAPATFESIAGSRKVGYAYTDCIVHNCLPTDSRDIEEIEREFTTLHEDKELIMNKDKELLWV